VLEGLPASVEVHHEPHACEDVPAFFR